MKKIIIIAGGILCILAFLIFMAQTCEQEGQLTYPSYTGKWSYIIAEDNGVEMKVEISLTETTWTMDFYSEADPWDYMFGVKGTITVDGDNFTMTVNGGRWYDTPYTEWYDWTNDPLNRFYYTLGNLIEGPYAYDSNFGWYAASAYETAGTYPQIQGKWAISTTGNSLLLHFSMWGANYFYNYAHNADYYTNWWSWFTPETIPDQAWLFTKVE
ncbi:MAG: hypothetical protein JSV25_15125 [Spirochaetota bacterium]|nr:MAG: hypothetical protein JSV25_15125 [Spirochaetota bacterium]